MTILMEESAYHSTRVTSTSETEEKDARSLPYLMKFMLVTLNCVIVGRVICCELSSILYHQGSVWRPPEIFQRRFNRDDRFRG